MQEFDGKTYKANNKSDILNINVTSIKKLLFNALYKKVLFLNHLTAFYLTNMQPQWQKHNGGLWKNLEDLVRNIATDDSKTNAHCDTLYIVKAATITDKVTINDVEVDGIYDRKKSAVEINLQRFSVSRRVWDGCAPYRAIARRWYRDTSAR